MFLASKTLNVTVLRIFWLPQVSLCADKSDVFMRSLLILWSEPFTRMLPESGWSYYCWGTVERLELAEANLPVIRSDLEMSEFYHPISARAGD